MDKIRKVDGIKTSLESGVLNHGVLDFVKMNFPDKGLIITWTDEGIYWGIKEAGRFEFHIAHVDEYIENNLIYLRAFNPLEELYIWKRQSFGNKSYFYRLRRDNRGEDVEVIESKQLIWGTHAENKNGIFYRIWEPRNIELFVPSKDAHLNEINLDELNMGNRLFLITRNYIGYHKDTNEAYFRDVRFVNISLLGGNK